MKQKNLLFVIALIAYSSTCMAQKKVTVIENPSTTIKEGKQFIKRKVAIGRFSNETTYGKGLFYDKANDPMGKQALDILSTKLAESGKFILLERNDMTALLSEAQKNESNAQQVIGADYLIIGSITEFGRKNTGQTKVFSSSKTQTVEAAVSVRLVDVSSGQIIYSEEGKGSAELTTKSSFLGTGGKADYDATLSDKAISAAVSQLVENIVNKCTNKPWRSYILSSDKDGIIIAGGASQGITAGQVFNIKQKGKKVKNPQTGITFELPGKTIGTVTVVSTGGDTPETEYSVVTLKDGGSINAQDINNCYIEE